MYVCMNLLISRFTPQMMVLKITKGGGLYGKRIVFVEREIEEKPLIILSLRTKSLS